MRATKILMSAVLLHAAAIAQVVAPEEVRDPQMSALQREHLGELKLITKAAAEHSFPYRFYFSRALDLAEKEQQRSDQRSVQFDRYQGRTVLKITGNYYASYSTELMKPEERARQTYEDVILPLLQESVKALDKTDVPEAFAFEISHHVRKKVLGVSSEGVENVVLILPRDSAQRLIAATDPQARRAAIFEGQAFLNTVPVSFWPRPEGVVAQAAAPAKAVAPSPAATVAPTPKVEVVAKVPPGVLSKVPAPAAVPAAGPTSPRDTSPDALKNLQNSHQADLDKMVQDLDSQAHFVRYAPPAFIPFHNGIYLQVSVTTTLPQASASSQYRLAALAFDQHIAHLIRPVLAHFKTGDDSDGIDFSTSIRLAGEPSSDAGAVAVEFIFPLNLLHSYEQFDCTGQQLIDAGFVLINGERISLNLQVAEAAVR